MVIEKNKMIHFLEILHDNPKPLFGAIASSVFFVFGSICKVFFIGVNVDDLRAVSYAVSIVSGVLAISYTLYKFCKDLKNKSNGNSRKG